MRLAIPVAFLAILLTWVCQSAYGDHYSTLGVSQRATEVEIKKAYKQLARKYHPDKNSDPGAQNRFIEVSAAYEVLSDPKKRREYDSGGVGVNRGFGYRRQRRGFYQTYRRGGRTYTYYSESFDPRFWSREQPQQPSSDGMFDPNAMMLVIVLGAVLLLLLFRSTEGAQAEAQTEAQAPDGSSSGASGSRGPSSGAAENRKFIETVAPKAAELPDTIPKGFNFVLLVPAGAVEADKQGTIAAIKAASSLFDDCQGIPGIRLLWTQSFSTLPQDDSPCKGPSAVRMFLIIRRSSSCRGREIDLRDATEVSRLQNDMEDISRLQEIE